MMLQTVTSIIYDITAHSWALASILVKYYIVVAAAQLYTGSGLTKEDFRDKILRESRIVVPMIVLAGAATYAIGFKLDPVFRLFSEIIALVYLGFLFWKY